MDRRKNPEIVGDNKMMIKKTRRKLTNAKGETLGEVLVASLLAGIALLSLSSMIMVSHRIIDRSSNVVKAFYEEINEIERQSLQAKNGIVTIRSKDSTQVNIDVQVYKTEENGLAIYKR